MSERDFMTLSRPQDSGNDDYGLAMLTLLQQLHSAPIRSSTLALIRHSARHYGQTENDLDNPLSDAGRDYCRRFGDRLPRWGRFATCSSPAGRCVETAELISESHAHPLSAGNTILEDLAVFYVRDMRKVGGMMKRIGPQGTLQRWFAGEIPGDIMMPPAEACERLVARLRSLLAEAPADQLTLCVSHDWSIYLLRHLMLDLAYGEHPPATYLDGFAFWLEGERLAVASELCGIRYL